MVEGDDVTSDVDADYLAEDEPIESQDEEDTKVTDAGVVRKGRGPRRKKTRKIGEFSNVSPN